MMERFTKEARDVVRRAEDEARALGDRTIEAEHLLLALSRLGAVSVVLEDAGLGVAALLAALDAEQSRSLTAVGVDPSGFGLAPGRTRRGRGSLRFGASAKLALERSLRAAVARRDRHIGARHLLLGVLAADHGRVPRALEHAGVERADVIAAV